MAVLDEYVDGKVAIIVLLRKHLMCQLLIRSVGIKKNQMTQSNKFIKRRRKTVLETNL